MNKTVAANISGIIFNIEENAYEKLGKYLETIRGYFKNAEGDDEIMQDIEARIAELFQERLSDGKQVVNMKDVDEVISIMGQPEDYLAPEEDEALSAKKSGTSSKGHKRIFRDPDDQWIGGVAAGIAKYFGIDPIVLRVIWLISIIFGFGFLIYIILWIIIPEAKTTAEKLQMEGEAVTVENIKNRVQQEKENVERGFDNLKNDLQNSNNAFGKFIGDLFSFLGQFLLLFFKTLGKIIGVVLVMVGVLALVALGLLLFGSLPYWEMNGSSELLGMNWTMVKQIIFASADQANLGLAGVIITICIPIVAMIYGGLAILFDLRASNKGLGIALSALWVAGIFIVSMVCIQVGTEFSSDHRQIEQFPIEQPKGNVLYLDILNDKHFSDHFRDHDDRAIELFKVENDQLILGWPYLDVWESETDSFSVEIHKHAHGKSQKMAIRNSEAMQYRIEQTDSLLQFQPWYSFPLKNKFRGQHIKYIVRVPIGKAVHLKPLSDRIIYDIDNVEGEWDGDMVGKTWTMTRRGLDDEVAPGELPKTEQGTVAPESEESEEGEEDVVEGPQDNDDAIASSHKLMPFPIDIWHMLSTRL